MKIVADFHIHSKYSRAVSRDMNLETLDIWAKKKGIQVMGTGDFTHPQWFSEIKTKLEPAELGLFRLKSELDSPTRFMLTVEISSIYSKNGKTRRVHNLIFSPSIETAEKINTTLSLIGNIKSDGRPILGLDSKKLLQIVLGIDPRCVFIPAHAWTPWFSVFGSMSGFDSLEECFEDLSGNIFAIETGLSSDPAMNWRLSMLDKISLISNSDSHSPQKIGREANVFDCELSYDGLIDAIKSRDPKKFLFTVEFFPEEGKYHYDGHRLCNVSMSPQETKSNKGICPKCRKPMTIGVMNRVDKLADRKVGEGKEGRIPFLSLIPLNEIIADIFGMGVSSLKVRKEYEQLVEAVGNEFKVLMDADYGELKKNTSEKIASGIISVRAGRVELIPGYDGEYGKIKVLKNEKEKATSLQSRLF
ncbi:MAG: DNA helicase UvrD [Candidatus Tagabacteria bacterium CG_4_10_14_0_2_um_filter_40_13]|uniref:DNA helicase UvrD n=3 Tax=Candidatus Tagaibacteriota TaxID=1817918 RepID=A0A2M8G8G1_9BACT|nr:MAG: DNA helicase UvrD [Candidatus Tagabacteria bacterium CG11_big_fil_rev_8_21_14_0_20_41_11]PIU99486.1 MAG: DNA helicase UvrD [Candidatus Tagabacteria bacterium CG03_land_8_20_14_0_80_41_22]PIZ56585.1 MAG: DNA helicase UvrD [Candidatus Tagabacteria bacterium CG_4_10_14_0_2_um_filter_40_13]PJC25139.1 MAG: DNA helicase UvrD [Candidatus Tagabacteria bacterium CG_4_9_14_0_2_um_filter_41_11]PJC69652.1 MAG: DNA helicase UvrD [Candidatus Tagabacteria bacterium CG_4_8_14_3_um_filter_41_8]